MNVGAIAGISALPVSTLPDHQPLISEGRSGGIHHAPLTYAENFLQSESGQYQVALVHLGGQGWPGNNALSDSTMASLLLLPLTWNELLSQLCSHATQTQPPDPSPIAEFGDVRIDLPRHEVRRANRTVQLTTLEFKVLKFFISHPHRVISREEFLKNVWGYRCYPVTRTVDNQVLRLRQKLELEPADPVHFQTVHGVGYKFVP